MDNAMETKERLEIKMDNELETKLRKENKMNIAFGTKYGWSVEKYKFFLTQTTSISVHDQCQK